MFFFSILIGLQVTYQVLTEFSIRLQEMALTKVLRLNRWGFECFSFKIAAEGRDATGFEMFAKLVWRDLFARRR